jgi:tetratricopeptide (TPR) repeat protein
MVRVQQLDDRDGAVEDAQQALQRCPEHAGAAYRLMELLLWADQTDKLIEALSAAASAVRDNKRRQAQPNEVAAMMRLGELYGRNTQWDEAAEVLSRVVKLDPERKATVDAHLALSKIYLEQRPDRTAALRHVQAVLALEPKHRDALVTLLDLHAQAGDAEHAREAAQRLVEASTEPAVRAHALLQLGRMELRLGRRRTAADALRAAVALEGPSGEAARDYKRELGEEEPWKRYLDALAEHVRLAEAGEVEDADLSASYLEIARIQQSKLHVPNEAFDTLRTGLRRAGENPGLGLELALGLARAGRHPESIAEYQRLLRIDPAHVDAWRGLVAALQEQGRPSEASVAASPLVVLGVATAVEKNLATQRKTRPGWARPGSYNPQSLQLVSAASAADESLVAPMLGALAEALGKVHLPHVERLGLGSRDRVPERADHPLRMVGDRLAEVFGIERYDMFLYHPQHGRDVLVDLSWPPTLLVPSFVPELSEAQQVFMIGRAMLSAVRGLHPALKLSLDDLQQALIVGARHAAPTFGTGWYDEGEISALSKKVGKALSRKNRKLLEEAAAHYVAGKEIDVVAWVATLERTRARGAALLTGDLPACAQLIRHLDPALANQEGATLVRSSELVADLLRFWLSEPALEFRRFIGVL